MSVVLETERGQCFIRHSIDFCTLAHIYTFRLGISGGVHMKLQIVSTFYASKFFRRYKTTKAFLFPYKRKHTLSNEKCHKLIPCQYSFVNFQVTGKRDHIEFVMEK